MSKLTESAAWRALAAHAKAQSVTRIADMFSSDPMRAREFSLEAAGLYLDYSKQRASSETRALLLKLAEQQDLSQWIARLFAGEPVNSTEQRAAMHMALRNRSGKPMQAQGRDVTPDVLTVLKRVSVFADQIRSEKKITDVVNIGIGGSDLGPRMVCDALADFADGPRAHFVANVDGAQLLSALKGLKPATTLFVVTSKTFTTQETMANARAARAWSAGQSQFAAVTANDAEARKFGIAAEHIFGFWDWVGGRYSLWSAVGLPIVLALGSRRFTELLSGAHAMDEHFSTAPLAANLPVLMGLLSIWNVNFLGAASQVVAPYAQRLQLFVSWLQQLEMESNGKGVDREGRSVDYDTAPAVWGDVGTNSQHAFFQMLHQGPALHPVDFIVPVECSHALKDQHQLLAAHALAQGAALMKGATSGDPHREYPGNRPSNTLLLARLDAFHLGALLALYEHRTFVQSVIWNINAFDQWGVELGKRVAGDVLGGDKSRLDASTQALLARLKAH
ncbi:MAG: glucose-6-phosphate isomerase [Pseudomonadota bacterium]